MMLISFNKIVSSLTVIATIATLGTGGAFAAKPTPAPTVPLGNDISYPQCRKSLPTNQAFGIVGVNDGLANTTNPCFASELGWAQKSAGGTSQDKAALYVNTANPGHASTSWPSDNNYKGITVPSDAYGTCDGSENAACAYVYGYEKAYDDVNYRGVANPNTYKWWLDVETMNSWGADKAANAADLEGMTAYFQSIGARVGIYSTGYQWGQIAGTVSATSNLNGLDSWLAGAGSLSGAKTACANNVGLTPGSTVSLAQYVASNLDYDYSCL